MAILVTAADVKMTFEWQAYVDTKSTLAIVQENLASLEQLPHDENTQLNQGIGHLAEYAELFAALLAPKPERAIESSSE